MKQIQGKQGIVRNIRRFVKPRVREIGIPLYLWVVIGRGGRGGFVIIFGRFGGESELIRLC